MVYIKILDEILYNPNITFCYDTKLNVCSPFLDLYIIVNGDKKNLRRYYEDDYDLFDWIETSFIDGREANIKDEYIKLFNEFIEKCINDLFEHITDEKYDFTHKLNNFLEELDDELKKINECDIK